MRKAYKSLELLVVQDIFMTETAKFAHVILPGASFIEKMEHLLIQSVESSGLERL